MYQFKIKTQSDGNYKLELGDINIIIDGYTVDNGKHLLTNPAKAIAYFNIDNNIYGISNEPFHYESAEAFYDAIMNQYIMFSQEVKRTA